MYNLMNKKQVVSMIPSDINFMRRQVSADFGMMVGWQGKSEDEQ